MENKKIIFIHANGFPPNTYENMFNPIREDFNCENYILKPAENDISSILKLKNWNIFSEKFLDTLKSENKIIGIGHSIGGNVILRSAIRKPENFSKIILLDPTLFTPITIFFWRISAFLNIQKIVHPWLKTSLNRKMIYNNFEEIFNSYRKKEIFRLINDDNLRIYIKSITTLDKGGRIIINFSNFWEHQIYRTGLFTDMEIWNNLKKLKVPTLILKAKKSTAFSDSAALKIKKMNLSNIKIKTIENSSHLFPLEFPEKTAKEILSYINSN